MKTKSLCLGLLQAALTLLAVATHLGCERDHTDTRSKSGDGVADARTETLSLYSTHPNVTYAGPCLEPVTPIDRVGLDPGFGRPDLGLTCWAVPPTHFDPADGMCHQTLICRPTDGTVTVPISGEIVPNPVADKEYCAAEPDPGYRACYLELRACFRAIPLNLADAAMDAAIDRCMDQFNSCVEGTSPICQTEKYNCEDFARDYCDGVRARGLSCWYMACDPIDGQPEGHMLNVVLKERNEATNMCHYQVIEPQGGNDPVVGSWWQNCDERPRPPSELGPIGMQCRTLRTHVPTTRPSTCFPGSAEPKSDVVKAFESL